MIIIEIPRENAVDSVPAALLHAVLEQREKYQERNTGSDDNNAKAFDRLFEKLNPGCRIEYHYPEAHDRIIWENDEDYILFCLRWA